MKKILLVDDEKDIVETLKFRLQSSGYEVVVAYDGHEALEKVKEQPDLILLDIMMPGMDGFTVLQRLKEDFGTRSIPVVMLTCRRDSASVFQAQDLEADEYLMKPVDAEKLLKVVKKHI
jgi:two-component system alkaline phosphatase synthesis response regulator PhoP